jgi:hypothetical protein
MAARPITRYHSSKPLSQNQLKLLTDIAAGSPVGTHCGATIDALLRRGPVWLPRVDAFGKYPSMDLRRGQFYPMDGVAD